MVLDKCIQLDNERRSTKDQDMSSRCFKLKLTLKYQIFSVAFHKFLHTYVSVSATQTKTWNSPEIEPLRRIPHTLFLSGSLLPKSNYHFDFYHYRLVLPVFEAYMNGVIQYVLFSDWLALCTVVCVNIHAFLFLSSILDLFIHSPLMDI